MQTLATPDCVDSATYPAPVIAVSVCSVSHPGSEPPSSHTFALIAEPKASRRTHTDVPAVKVFDTVASVVAVPPTRLRRVY